MEIIFEFLFELMLEGVVELGTNIKVPKYIRYPVSVFIILFVVVIIGLMFWLGIVILKDDIFFGILMIGLGVFFLIGIIVQTYKHYHKRKSGGEKLDK